MNLSQELTKNDIKEGLIRVSRHNLVFFYGGEKRSEDYQLQVMLPDGIRHFSTITYHPQTGSPRFLKDTRGALRTFYQKVNAKVGDVLKIEKVADDDFIVQYQPKATGSPPQSNGPGSRTVAPLTTMEPSELGLDTVPPTPNDAQSACGTTADAQATLALDTPKLNTGEREAVVKVRFGQGDFRDVLLKIDGDKCWMSGIEGKRLLIASHIKPWSQCGDDTDSRGQPNNGLLLSALWDTVFDAGLISFDSEWNVVVSSELSETAKQALGLSERTSLPTRFRTDGRKHYLAHHRAEVFECWKKTGSQKKDLT